MVAALAVYTSIGSHEEARALARRVIESRLAACAQINEIESFYHWQGDVANEPEFRILFKTTPAAYGALEALIKAYHPYEEPAIYALEVSDGAAGYLDWIAENVNRPNC